MSGPTRDEILAAFAVLGAAFAEVVEHARREPDGAGAAVGETYDSAAQVRDRTGLGLSTIAEMTAAGRLPSLLVGRRRLYPRTRVDAALAVLGDRAAG